DAELRRQRAAYRRGLWRAAAVSAAVLAVVIVLALTALNQARLANRQRGLADRQRRLAEARLYVSDTNLAQQAWDAGNLERPVDLLDRHQPRAGREDPRGFEWYYLWRLCRGDAV